MEFFSLLLIIPGGEIINQFSLRQWTLHVVD